VLTRGECAQRCPESYAAGNEVEQIKETAAGDNIGKVGGALPGSSSRETMRANWFSDKAWGSAGLTPGLLAGELADKA
jgi:hypothetical protein